MRKSSLKLLGAVAGVCLLAAGCTGGSPSSSSSDSGDSQTIKWLIEAPEDAAALKALKAHVANDFTKQTGIKVETSTLPFENMRTILQTQLRSGEGPDVFNWGSGPSFGGALAKAGLLMDLTDAYQKYGWQVYDFAKKTVTVDGKLYGVPGELETIGLFYNKDMFKQLGIAEPKSIDDLRAASEKIKAAGKIPMAVGDKEGWEGGHLLSMALASDVGSSAMADIINGDASWNSPQVASSFQLWADFDQEGLLPKSPTSVNYDASTSLFYSGDAAMIPTGSWLVGEIDDNTDFNVGYIPFPGPDGQGIFTGGLGSGPFISATTSKKDAAVKFVNFLASPAHGKWVVENLHTIPPFPIDTQGLNVSPLFAKVLNDTARLAKSGDFGYNIDVLVSDAVNEAMYDGFQGVLTGQMSADDAAKGMATAADQG
jgi:raffinose/stachyose/melibiose transport system substrate-binding protein